MDSCGGGSAILTLSTVSLPDALPISGSSSGLGYRIINGSIDNQGTITLNQDTTWGGSSPTYTNSGTVTIASGQALTLAGANSAFTQSAGSLTVNGTLSFTGASSTYTHSGGTVTVNGTLSSGTLSSTNTLAFTQSGGTFALPGALSLAGGGSA